MGLRTSLGTSNQVLMFSGNNCYMMQIPDISSKTISVSRIGDITFKQDEPPVICATTKGTFWIDPQNRNLYLFPLNSESKLFVKDVSSFNATLNSSICYQEEGLWHLNYFQDVNYTGSNTRIRTLLVDGSVYLEAAKMVRADLVYYNSNSPLQSSSRWIAYYDKENSSLVWHGAETSLIESNLSSVFSKFQLSINRCVGKFIVSAAGKYSCKLLAEQIGNFTFEAKGVNTTVLFQVDVGQQLHIQPNKKSQVVEINKPKSGDTVSQTYNLEEYFTFTGPVLSARTSFGFNMQDMVNVTGSISLKNRASLKYVVEG